jgi:hypothetical protein
MLKQVQQNDKNGFTLARNQLKRLRSVFRHDVLDVNVGGCHDRNDMLPSEIETAKESHAERLQALEKEMVTELEKQMKPLWKPVLEFLDFLQVAYIQMCYGFSVHRCFKMDFSSQKRRHTRLITIL